MSAHATAPTRAPDRRQRTVVWSAAADTVAIVVFVIAGRRSHDQGGNALVETIRVGAPFLVALAIGWLAARAWRRPTSLTVGAAVWAVTVVVGMLLRRFVSDRGTAPSFVVVATLVTGALLLGWRVVATTIARRR